MSRKVFFHGSCSVLTSIDPTQFSNDGELLCASASVNVARRYGAVITRIRLTEISEEKVFKSSVFDWFNARVPSIDKLREQGIKLVILIGTPESFDFPSDTLFVLDSNAVVLDSFLHDDEIKALDDGLSIKHEPTGPSDTGWVCYVNDLYQGDEAAALSDRPSSSIIEPVTLDHGTPKNKSRRLSI